MRKKEFLEYWEDIPENQRLRIKPVQYKHIGSTYAEDGIRITGSQKFIESMLSRIKDLLDYEDERTRLQVVFNESFDKDTGRPLGSYNCYIQVHRRGGYARLFR